MLLLNIKILNYFYNKFYSMKLWNEYEKPKIIQNKYSNKEWN